MTRKVFLKLCFCILLLLSITCNLYWYKSYADIRNDKNNFQRLQSCSYASSSNSINHQLKNLKKYVPNINTMEKDIIIHIISDMRLNLMYAELPLMHIELLNEDTELDINQLIEYLFELESYLKLGNLLSTEDENILFEIVNVRLISVGIEFDKKHEIEVEYIKKSFDRLDTLCRKGLKMLQNQIEWY